MAENGRRHGKRRRDELALAAADWVIEHGLADLSLRRLAAGIGVSHRMLLYHFGSKDELFQAILRAARTREQQRAVAPTENDAQPYNTLRRTWQYLSSPKEHAFWRFYFEIHGLALQNPDRYPDVLHEGIHDWLRTIRELLIRDGAPEQQASAFATLIISVFRGLTLDLLQTGERERVDSAFEILAQLSRHVTTTSQATPATNKTKQARANTRAGAKPTRSNQGSVGGSV
jgi:AcrR family transcriptional regulator